MKKQRFPLIPVLGITLLLLGLGLFVVFQIQLHTGTRKSLETADKLEKILPERTQGAAGFYPDVNMPALEIDGMDYVAMLEIPTFGLQLPVAAAWNGDQLAQSPARFLGSAYDNTLVIGGADHEGQFAFCGEIDHGAAVIVTDMTGAQFTYTVARVDRAGHAPAQWLTEGDWDLTLFCHDVYAMEYIAVRCVE